MNIDPTPFCARDQGTWSGPFRLRDEYLAAATNKSCLISAPAGMFTTPPCDFDSFYHRAVSDMVRDHTLLLPGDFTPLQLPDCAPDLTQATKPCERCECLGLVGKPCPTCEGSGEVDCECCGQPTRCRDCHGDGEAPTRSEPCPACDGTGAAPTSTDVILRCTTRQKLIAIDLRYLRLFEALAIPFTLHLRHDPQDPGAGSLAGINHPILVRFHDHPEVIGLIMALKRKSHDPAFREALALQWPGLNLAHPFD